MTDRLEFSYDEVLDILTVGNVRFKGDFFRYFKEPVDHVVDDLIFKSCSI